MTFWVLTVTFQAATFGGLYPAPIFHMDSIWIPCGFHVIPGGFHPFHMEYVLAGIPLIFLIPFHFYSMWIPYGFHMEWSYSITIPWNVHMDSIWNGYGFHMDSTWNDELP